MTRLMARFTLALLLKASGLKTSIPGVDPWQATFLFGTNAGKSTVLLQASHNNGKRHADPLLTASLDGRYGQGKSLTHWPYIRAHMFDETTDMRDLIGDAHATSPCIVYWSMKRSS